jgi:hypothetical protein
MELKVKFLHTTGTQSKTGSPLATRELSILLEAAIGIEPMNKGFAVHSGHISLSVMERHSRINIEFLAWLVAP